MLLQSRNYRATTQMNVSNSSAARTPMPAVAMRESGVARRSRKSASGCIGLGFTEVRRYHAKVEQMGLNQDGKGSSYPAATPAAQTWIDQHGIP
jgi:hypothetical protein